MIFSFLFYVFFFHERGKQQLNKLFINWTMCINENDESCFIDRNYGNGDAGI